MKKKNILDFENFRIISFKVKIFLSTRIIFFLYILFLIIAWLSFIILRELVRNIFFFF